MRWEEKLIDAESQSVVISPKFLDELKRLPDDTLSFSKAVDEVSLSHCHA